MPSKEIVYLDANILLEIILSRKNQEVARKAIKKYAGSLHISTLTAHLVVHFGQAIVELPGLRKFLTDYYIEDLTEKDFEWAFVNARSKNFEDALQIASAVRIGTSRFLTFDKELHRAYKNLPTIKVQLLLGTD